MRDNLKTKQALISELQELRKKFDVIDQQSYLQDIFENSSDALFIIDVTPEGQFNYISFNPVAEKIIRPLNKFHGGTPVENCYSPEDAGRVLANYKKCADSGVVTKYVIRFDSPEGKLVFHSTLVPLKNSQGTVHRIIGVAHEMTEQESLLKQIESEKNRLQLFMNAMGCGITIQDNDFNIIFQNEHLRESEAFNSRLLNYSIHPILVYNLDFSIKYVNPAFERLTGFTKDELIGISPPFPYWPKSRIGEIQSGFDKNRRNKSFPDGEYWFQKKNREPFLVQSTFTTISDNQGKNLFHLVHWEDITQRKEAEEALKESEFKFRMLAEHAQEMIYRIRLYPDIQFEYVSPASVAVLGFTPDELYADPEILLRQTYPDDRDQVMAFFTSHNPSGKIIFRLFHKNGSLVWIELSETKIFAGKQIIASECLVRNVTEQKQAEENLKASERRFRELADLLPVIAFEADLKGKVSYVNNLASELFGYTKEEIFAKSIFDFITSEDRERSQNNTRRVLAGECLGNNEYQVLKKDGSWIPTLIQTAPRLNNLGILTGLRGVIVDISTQKKIEDKLRWSERKYRDLIEQMQEGILVNDENMIITYANPRMTEILGYTSEELIGKSLRTLNPDDEVDINESHYTKLEQGFHLTLPNKMVHKTGNIIHVRAAISPVIDRNGQFKGTFAVIEDITAARKAEEALKESELKFRALFEQTQDGVILLDSQGKIIGWNAAQEKISSISKEEMLDKHLWDHPEGVDLNDHNLINSKTEFDLAIQQLLKTKQSPLLNKLTEIEFKNRVGETRICLSVTGIIEMGNDFMIGLTTKDITERKKVERELQKSEEKYHSLVQNIKLVIFRSTAGDKDKLLEFNKSLEEFTGYSREELFQIDIINLYANPEDRRELIKQLELTPEKATINTYLVKKDRTPFPVTIIAKAVMDKNGRVMYLDGSIEDITESKKMEDRIIDLYQQEKKQREELQEEAKARGMFIDVLAHELRTPLTPILASTEMLQDLMSPEVSDMQSKLMKNILKGSHTLAQRLEELLDLARYTRGTFRLQIQPVNFHKLIEDIVSRFKPIFDQCEQQLVVEISPDISIVRIDPSRLEQVLINLLSNASKFSPAKDKIILKVRNEAENLVIEITDNGIGISEEEQARLFQPYHRVEQDRHKFPGLGLGLAVSKQIVEAHEGKIWVTSQLGHGSTFHVMIPNKITPSLIPFITK